MRTYKEVTSTRTVLDSMVCDMCKKAQSVDEHSWPNENGTPCKYYEVQHTTIKWSHGESYPESRSGEDVTIDLCPQCFAEKLLTWLKEQGVEPAIKEWEDA